MINKILIIIGFIGFTTSLIIYLIKIIKNIDQEI